MNNMKARITRITGIFTVAAAISAVVGYGLYCYIKYTLLNIQIIFIDGIEVAIALLALTGILAGLKIAQTKTDEGNRSKLLLISISALVAAIASPLVTALTSNIFGIIDIIRICYIIITALIFASEAVGVIGLLIRKE